jgi:phosphatidylserine/phosphatidylglycerophosphate/cardiolipin synthase-like enzyme
MNGNKKLVSADLQALKKETVQALLSYVNLPLVGYYDDVAGVPRDNGSNVYEVSTSVREALLRRRGSDGRFESLSDLINLDGFGRDDLDEIVDRLKDTRRYGNRLYPVWGGPEAEREFFALLEGAEHHIHISTYIVGGEAGLRMAEILARKKNEGVQVRVMFCASGFVISGSPSGTGFVSRLSELRSYMLNDMYFRKRIIARLRESDVPMVNSAPIGRHWKRRSMRKRGVKNARDYQRWARDRGLPDEWLEEQERIDRQCSVEFANVDHRKMVVVDGVRAFIGSQNLADSYFYTNELSEDPRVNRKRWQWHDNSAILEGGAVQSLNEIFARRWQLSGGDIYDYRAEEYNPSPKQFGDAAVLIETSIPGLITMPFAKNFPRLLASMFGANLPPLFEGSNPIRDRLLAMPDIAQNDFVVEHCYPSDAELLSRWTNATRELSNFTMVVPLHYDTVLLGAECDRHYPDMINAGVNLWGYDKAIMHSKIAVSDGWYVAMGSYNLTQRSGRSDLELEFFVQSPSFGDEVRQRILDDLDECQRVEPGRLARFQSRRSLPLLDALVRYFIF